MFSKTLFKKYGTAGLTTYTGISIISFASWFAAISLGLDTDKLMDSIKTRLNLSTESSSSVDANNNVTTPNADAITNTNTKNTSISKAFEWKQLGTNLIMTVAAHNLIFPIRFGLTLYLTPYLARVLQTRGLFNKIL